MKVQSPLLIVALLAPLYCASPLVFPPSSRIYNSPDALCNCTGTTNGGNASAAYICRDSRLGPNILPRKIPLSGFLTNYDRFGGLSPGEYLAKWTNSSTGAYIYPELKGFSLDANGNAINGTMTLDVGTFVDRFGSEYGDFLSAADAPYSQRSLPPSNLDTSATSPDYPYNYHIYQVLKPLSVVGGPIAPWFGQPGLGAQFYTGAIGTILELIDGGYLARVNDSLLISTKQGCGVGNCISGYPEIIEEVIEIHVE